MSRFGSSARWLLTLCLVGGLPASLDAQCAWCGPGETYSVSVTPNGSSFGTVATNTTGYTHAFTVRNTGNAAAENYQLTCSGTNGISCSVSPGSVTLSPNGATTVTATFNTGSGTGAANLTVTATSPRTSGSGTATGTIVRYSVSVTPDGSGTATRTAWTGGYGETFTVHNTGSATNTFGIGCGGSNGVTCTGTSTGSVTLGANASTGVTAYYNVGGPGTGTLTLSANGTNASDGGSFSVPIVSYGVSVTPDGGGAATRTAWTNGHGESFTVYNSGSATNTYSISCGGSNGVTCTGTSASSVTVGAYSSTAVTAYYNVGGPATGTLTLNASGTNASDGGSFSVPIVSYGVSVTPDGGGAAPRTAGTGGHAESFTVYNSGSATNTYSIGCGGSSGVTCTGTSAGSVTVGAYSSTSVTAYYSVGAPGTGTLTLSASGTNASDGGSYTVPVGVAPPVTLVAHNGDHQARELCFTVEAGSGAMVQCGDLVVAHGMPVYRTLGRDRSLTLVYNSATAVPRRAVTARVTLAGGTTPPDNVYTELRVAGSLVASGTFSSWGAGETRQVVLGFDALNWDTGAYPFTLLVRNLYAGYSYDTVVGDTLLVVNRATSEFGAGWWLGGVEQLVLGQPGNTILWVGSDGSARVYRPSGSVWVGAAGGYRDQIVWTGSHYERQLKHGIKVRFDAAGRHVETETRVGHRTAFSWTAPGGATRLTSITVPPAGTGGSYTLGYQGGSQYLYLDWIDDPAGRRLNTHIDYPTARGHSMTYIQDPDLRQVFFGYDGVGRLNSRTDRRGNTQAYQYANGWRVTLAAVPLNTSETAVTTLVEYLDLHAVWGQPGGTLTAGQQATPWISINGPRTDLADVTEAWLDRWGAPILVRDALGQETHITRGDVMVPALVTQVQAPSGLVTQATYDPRGNLLSTTAINPFGTGQNAVTRYEYEGNFDFVTKIVPPEGDSTLIDYDGQGNRIWQQDARGDSTRVTFSYWTGAKAGLVRFVDPPPAGQAYEYDYDGRSNLSWVRTPLGFVTQMHADAYGRDTMVVSPIDGVATRRDRSVYDVMGRVDSVISIGPAVGSAPTETLHVANTYDANGNLLQVARRAAPDGSGVGTLVTDYRYDAGNRRVYEGSLGGRKDSTVYDLAGNPIQTLNPGALRATMEYDALGRLTRRVVPMGGGHVFGGCAGDVCGNYTFPLYPNSGSTLVIAEDTVRFQYGPNGEVLVADNRFVRIRRSYTPAGAIATDSLWVRDHARADFDFTGAAAYGLRYTYDRNGRRTELHHPSNLAPFQETLQTYGYTNFGALASVQGIKGHVHSFGYDAEGRQTHWWYPGGVETRRYDVDGRRVRRYEDASGMGVLHHDTLTYDQRGRTTLVNDPGLLGWTGTLRYSGLGHLVESDLGPAAGGYTHEKFTSDALGNRGWDWTDTQASDFPAQKTAQYMSGGRLHRLIGLPPYTPAPPDWVPDSTTYRFDVAGNVSEHSESAQRRWEWGVVRSRTAAVSFFSADERLMAYQVYRDSVNEFGQTHSRHGVWEEYWYDALGRRVLVRSLAPSTICDRPGWCAGARTHTVWDGDQVLWERRDADTPAGASHQYGRVGYTHGPGIDTPLDLVKDGATVVIPHQSWRGVYDVGTTPGGAQFGCTPNWFAGCAELGWPAGKGTAYIGVTEADPPPHWYGSLIRGQRDESGQLYMRNRYYDAKSGRFTQEDPIGLAGGLNLYGFANGDPINFRDPFGLTGCSRADWTRCKLISFSIGWGAGIGVGGQLGPVALRGQIGKSGVGGSVAQTAGGEAATEGHGGMTVFSGSARVGPRQGEVSFLSCSAGSDGNGCTLAKLGVKNVDVASNGDIGASFQVGVELGTTVHLGHAATAVAGAAETAYSAFKGWVVDKLNRAGAALRREDP